MQNDYTQALDLFLEICKIPHASFHTESLREWIIKEATKSGAKVKCDKAGNIHCIKGNPKLCLQGHYDMVYVSSNKEFSITPQFITKDGKEYLCAKDSSLGADNGIAVACMLLALKNTQNLECLFTNDEEVGMLGANGIDLDLIAPFMLNCDSEEIDEIVESCAGGYDLECKISLDLLEIPQNCTFLRICTKGFQGGHSGIEIHKGIPNAIIELAKIAKTLCQNGALMLSFSGGEKRNSIPVNAEFSVAIPKKYLEQCQEILEQYTFIESYNCTPKTHYFNAQALICGILSLENGVIKQEENMPMLSSNLGILRQKEENAKLEFCLVAMGRGNVENALKAHCKKEQEKMQNLGFKAEVLDYYSPWEREDSALLNVILEIYQTYRENPQLKKIHAGLECGILKQKYPHISFVSIGPSIAHPHSLQEILDLESFASFVQILNATLKRFDAF